ncbi:response regulator [Chloroflexota bacterium]
MPEYNAHIRKSGKFTVLIADDHPLLRRSLKNILEQVDDYEVIAEAINGEEAVKLSIELKPDLVVMDIGMPKIDGLEATRQIKSSCPNIAVLVLTIHSDDEHIIGILKAGAAGYLTKSVYAEEVVQAIRGILAGEMVLSPDIGQKLLKKAALFPDKPILLRNGEKFSRRELMVIKLTARGMSNADIAKELQISVRTVKGCLSIIFSKFNVASRTEAVMMAMQTGLISIDDIQ